MSDFYARLQQAVGAAPPGGVQLAPRIDPKRLANAAKWAAIGHEQPMLLIDNTVFGSGKAGILLTSHALHFDEPRTRIDLAEILEPPIFPNGTKEGGTLRTRGVDRALPALLGDDEAEIFRRVLLTIVAFNRGTSTVVMQPVPGPIGALALQLLQQREIHLAPDLPRKKVRSAAASFAQWLDHAGGEQPVAYLDETTFGKGDQGLLLTDRRLLAHVTEGSKHVSIPYGAITAVRASGGMLGKKLAIDAGQHGAEIPLVTCADAIEPIAAFLQQLLQLHPDQRWAPPAALATAEDPSGAFGLLQALGAPDARIPIMLRFVGEMTRRGAMPPAFAADLVTRIHLLHRTLAYGRGMTHGFRTSPLHGADLQFVLGTVFGDPVSSASSQQAPDPYRGGPGAVHHTLDYALGRRANLTGLATAAVGVALLAVVGVGFLSTPKTAIQGVRVIATDLAAVTGFAPYGVLNGHAAPLGDVAPEILEKLLDALDDLEALVTFYRVVLGWGPSPQELLQWAPELPARVADALGPTDLSLFDGASGDPAGGPRAS